MEIRPQKPSTRDSQIGQGVREQTEMIMQDARRNAMQAHIK